MATFNIAQAPKRSVKLDYSGTYRDNDSLDDTLSSQIESLQKVHFRASKDKESEIEAAKEDAEKIQILKEVVNQRDTNKEISNIFKSRHSEDFDDNGQEISKSQRRFQKELEKFSARNHFNVVLPKFNPFADIGSRKQFSSITNVLSRPSISIATAQNKDKPPSRKKNYMQMTSSSRGRLARPRSVPPALMNSNTPDVPDVAGARCKSATRSRRELQELSRIELSLKEPKLLTPYEHRQNILMDLRDQQKGLQRRVSRFILELENFNNRKRKNALAKYLHD